MFLKFSLVVSTIFAIVRVERFCFKIKLISLRYVIKLTFLPQFHNDEFKVTLDSVHSFTMAGFTLKHIKHNNTKGVRDEKNLSLNYFVVPRRGPSFLSWVVLAVFSCLLPFQTF